MYEDHVVAKLLYNLLEQMASTLILYSVQVTRIG